MLFEWISTPSFIWFVDFSRGLLVFERQNLAELAKQVTTFGSKFLTLP